MDDFLTVDWKITDLKAEDSIIKSAKYYVKASYEEIKVETEGYCYFNGFGGILLEEIKEEDVINWIKEIHSRDEVCLITERLKDQIKYLQSQTTIDFPWKPKTFKVSI